MPNKNQAAEGENQKAPEIEMTEDQMIAEAKKAIPFFDYQESAMEGEINGLINALYDKCVELDIPFMGAINFAVKDEGDGFSLGVRGIQVIGKDGFAPAPLYAMAAVRDNQELAELVLTISRDPVKMQMIKMLGGIAADH